LPTELFLYFWMLCLINFKFLLNAELFIYNRTSHSYPNSFFCWLTCDRAIWCVNFNFAQIVFSFFTQHSYSTYFIDVLVIFFLFVLSGAPLKGWRENLTPRYPFSCFSCSTHSSDLVVVILPLVLSVTLLVGWRENLMPRHLSSGISCSTHSSLAKPCYLFQDFQIPAFFFL
jgi:hypothetical protein